MREFKRVLFVSQGIIDETQALRQALSLTRNNGAALDALIVCPPFPNALARYKEAYEKSLADRLETAIRDVKAALHADAELPVAVRVECGKTPAIRMIRHVLRSDYDLVVKQAEPVDARSGLSAMDMELLRQCPCAVWLCRPILRSHHEIRVGVAIDPIHEKPSEQNLAINLLRLSRALADTCNGELTIISCWDYEFEEYLRHQPWMHNSEEELSQAVLETQQAHLAALHAVIGQAGIGGKVKICHARGRPDRAIPKLVSDGQIDILVIGTVARTGIPGLLMGNTAENVLQAVPCSSLALKPPGFVSAVKAYDR